MKTTIVYSLWIFLILSCLKINAQADNKPDSTGRLKHAIGAGVGFTTGYGLSYRYMPAKWGVQVNFAPYHTKETDRYSAGLTFLYYLIKARTTNLFLYQGNHYYYNSEMIYYMDPLKSTQTVDPTGYKVRQTDNYFNNGFGIGIEFIIAKRIGFDLMGGYAAYENFKMVNFTGETGLYFKF